MGGIGGLFAGAYRDATGKTVLQTWLDSSECDKRAFLEAAGVLLPELAAKKNASEISTASSNDGLSPAQLDALGVTEAQQGEAECVLCRCNRVNVIFKPCGHAQTCSRCAAEVLRMSRSTDASCPVCRVSIRAVSKVFIASASTAFSGTTTTAPTQAEHMNPSAPPAPVGLTPYPEVPQHEEKI
jgi:hypothetical protein